MQNIKIFDTTLRDGIQNASPEIFTTKYKETILNNILINYSPDSIEVGSFVSPKILPIMNDTLEIYNIAKKRTNINIYILIPTLKILEKSIDIIKENNINSLSFITSISNDFKIKNTKKKLNENKIELKKIDILLKELQIVNKKLYISCINECPIIGKIDNNKIIEEILFYNNEYNFNEICLSDTCGSLLFNDFKIIIDNLKLKMNTAKLSLHLHINNNYQNIKKIIFYCLDNKINKFDVSLLEYGGCSVTINKNNLLPNLDYNILNSII